MPRATNGAARKRQILRDHLHRSAVLRVLAAVVHATVSTVPVVAPLLNLTVNESPLFNVNADP